jgi:hypothetical protein
MKISTITLFSLGLNVLLALGVLNQLTPPVKTAPREMTDVATATPSSAAATGKTSAEKVVAEPVDKPFHWHMLESEDYRQFVANLRAIKCPEQTIQDIVYADLERLLAKKFRAVNVKYKINRDNASSDYWKSDEEFLTAKYERDREGRKVYDERRESLIALLGMDAEKERRLRLGLTDEDGSRYPFLNPQKLGAIRNVWAELKDMEAETNRKYGGYQGPEIREEFRRLALERDAAASQALTPQEKEEWMLSVSHTANLMRSSLAAFEPSEQEFRAMYKLEYDQYLKLGPYAYMGSVDPDDTAGLALKQETQKAKEAAFRELLGEQRYAEYTMAQSGDFKQLYQFTQSTGLEKVAAVQVYQMKQANDAEMARIASDQNLSPQQRQEAIVAVQQATANAVQGVLGEGNFNRYRTSYGRWLNNSSQTALPPGAIVLPNGTVIMRKP